MTTSPPRSAALPILVVLAVAVAAGLGLAAGQYWFAGATPPSLQGGLTYPAPRDLPAFSLDAPDAETLDAAALRGRWTLVFIGFTHCPDVCPTTLAQLAEAVRQADRAGVEAPQILFVSVDPERDTAARAAEYARHFHPQALAATADHARLTTFTRSLGMVYMHTPLEHGGSSVDHSSSIAVLDPKVRLVAHLRPPFDPATIVADLERLQDAYR